jgi:pre-mRNA-splicing factor ATP-dependent RNA helicase DHX15/PRP43
MHCRDQHCRDVHGGVYDDFKNASFNPLIL